VKFTSIVSQTIEANGTTALEDLRVRLALAMHKKLIAMGAGVSNLPWFSSRAFAQSESPQRDAA